MKFATTFIFGLAASAALATDGGPLGAHNMPGLDQDQSL